MRNVLKNHHEVCHYWANKIQNSGKSSNMFFEDGIIYSYGYHFPIAKHIKKDVNPSFETAVPGDIMQSTGNVTQSAQEKPLGDVFKPAARVAAENMFGAAVPGNFGRSMGG